MLLKKSNILVVLIIGVIGIEYASAVERIEVYHSTVGKNVVSPRGVEAGDFSKLNNTLETFSVGRQGTAKVNSDGDSVACGYRISIFEKVDSIEVNTYTIVFNPAKNEYFLFKGSVKSDSSEGKNCFKGDDLSPEQTPDDLLFKVLATVRTYQLKGKVTTTLPLKKKQKRKTGTAISK